MLEINIYFPEYLSFPFRFYILPTSGEMTVGGRGKTETSKMPTDNE